GSRALRSAMPTIAAGTGSPTAMPDERVVSVSGLTVRFATSERVVEAVRDLSFHVDAGETLALVGESG
ncbi:hypothetical protein CCS92_35690, partial [Methylobacterium radiotolerans]